MEVAGGLRSAARGVILHAFLVLLHASLQSDSVEGTLGTGGRSTMEGGFTEFIERDGGKVFCFACTCGVVYRAKRWASVTLKRAVLQ